jgi:hypothetical protein
VSWREEQRQDRLTRAQIARDQAEADARARTIEARAAAADRREDQIARDGRREMARDRRAKRRADRSAWLTGHVTDLLFLPVIVVPAILAWTAMAAYGHDLYGPLGWLLPAFSEGGMWVFAFARTITLRRHKGRPAWHLLAGTWVFAAVGAGLNFLHGLTAPGNQAHAGVGTGAVMALVSVAGVTAHQLITAGPRRSRAERQQRRLDRDAAGRVLAVRRAAIRDAAALLDEDGGARLVIAPGRVAIDGHGRLASLELPESADPTTLLAQVASEVSAEVGDLARSLREPLLAPPLLLPAPPDPEAAPVVASRHAAYQEATTAGTPLVPWVVLALARQMVRELVPPVARDAVPRGTSGVPAGEPPGEPAGVPDDEPARAPEDVPAGVPDEMRRRQVDRSDPDAEKARRMYRASLRPGATRLSERQLAEKFPGRGRTWARNRITECRDGLRPVADAR